MKVGICAVGAELLTGEIVDSNTAWLAARLVQSGCTISGVMIVGDERTRLVEALRWLADRSDVLVVGGGLGPTADDITRDAVTEFAGVELRRRSELVDHLQAVYERLERSMPPGALRQADVPEGAEVHPPKGTAAGFVLNVAHGRRTVRVHVLPGVPWEYRGAADEVVLPDLVARSGGRARVTRIIHVAGLGESGVGDRLQALTHRLEAARSNPAAAEHGVELGFLANDDEVLVKISADGASPREAQERTEPLVAEAGGLLGQAVTSIDDQRLEDVVVHLLRTHGATVATAEGFTAGRVAGAISAVPGSDMVLVGGLIAYTDSLVADLLGDQREVLARHGAVSPEVTAAMAVAARRCFGTDLAVATTGVTDDHPDRRTGDAIWAIATADGAVHVEERFIPAVDRDIIQVRGAAFALESLRRHLLADPAAAATATHVTP